VAAEGVDLEFTEDAVLEISRIAAQVNERVENIGARRLQTVMATLMEDLLFELPSDGPKSIVMDATQVRERLARVLEDDDLRRYIL
jgi:ATP-dependent HslUV protease ATP-binding subunit HslU